MINIKSKIIKIFLLIIAFIALSNFLVILIIPLPSSFILGMSEIRVSETRMLLYNENDNDEETGILIELTNGKLVFRYGDGSVLNSNLEVESIISPDDPVNHCKAFWYDTYSKKL